MLVSIIICTRNRAESLRATLVSLSHAAVPTGWTTELLVIDNGSTDQTPAVINEAQLNNLVVRSIHEPCTGQVRARNTGLRLCAGEVILFTDDDVRVPTHWIEGMCKPILNGTADAVQGGVRVAPHLDRPWLTGALRCWVAAVESPDQKPEGLVGANMAFDRRMAELTGGFDPRLGAGASGFYDDTVFGWTLDRAGKRTLYRPEIAVEHHFDPDRLTLGSFIKTARRMAQSRALVMQLINPNRAQPTLFALLTQLPGLAVRCLTQSLAYVRNRQPDAGFVVRYFCWRLWLAERNRASR